MYEWQFNERWNEQNYWKQERKREREREREKEKGKGGGGDVRNNAGLPLNVMFLTRDGARDNYCLSY